MATNGATMRIQALAFAMSLAVGTAICVVSAPAQTATPMSQNFCDVPLVVTRYNPSTQATEMVKGLIANDVRVRLANTPVEVTGSGIDDGPKRVALVLDNSAGFRMMNGNSKQTWRPFLSGMLGPMIDF